MKEKYVIGVDYGTDSVRAIIVDVLQGDEIASSVFHYPRWRDGLYCDASKNQFRQHPLDYTEGLEAVVRNCLHQVQDDMKTGIRGISFATTGSTPVAVNDQGIPLALLDSFSDNPNAMFILWKDHSSIQEADEINIAAGRFDLNYLKYVGGTYSSEWYWAKLLHILREDEKVKGETFTFVEHSDWMPFLLAGGNNARAIKRNVCAAGHKALWATAFNGLPPAEFYESVDAALVKYARRFGNTVYSADKPAGNLCQEWAERLGLSTQVKVGIGAIDAHVGAVGGEIKPYYMSKVIGTSTCDMITVPKSELKGKVIDGISGQVEDSIIPGMVGLEAGQSAFGDIYSWFRDLLLWPLHLDDNDGKRNGNDTDQLLEDLESNLLSKLDQQAAKLPFDEEAEFAIDWFNGRRTPHADPKVKGLIGGLTLGSNPPRVYRALVEATCFGARAIVESIEKQGIDIKGINALGGIATKSNYVIQTLSDVLNRPVHVLATDQPVALGAAMFASVVSGLHSNLEEAVKCMGKGDKEVITPRKQFLSIYNSHFERYVSYGKFQSDLINN